MKKKLSGKGLFSLLLAFCLVFAMTGCGKKDEVSNGRGESTSISKERGNSVSDSEEVEEVVEIEEKDPVPSDESDMFVAFAKAMIKSSKENNYKYTTDFSIDCSIKAEQESESFGMDFAMSLKLDGEYDDKLIHTNSSTYGSFFGFSETEKEESYTDLVNLVEYKTDDAGATWTKSELDDDSTSSIVPSSMIFSGSDSINIDTNKLLSLDSGNADSSEIQKIKDEVGIKDCRADKKYDDGAVDLVITLDADKFGSMMNSDDDDDDDMLSSFVSDPSAMTDFDLTLSIDKDWRITSWGIDLSSQSGLMDGTADTLSALSDDDGAEWSTDIREFYIKCTMSDFGSVSVTIPDSVKNSIVEDEDEDDSSSFTFGDDSDSDELVGSSLFSSSATIEEKYLGTSGLDVNTICEKCGFSKDMSTDGKYYQFAITFGNMVQSYTEEEVIDSAQYFAYSTMREQVALVLLSRLGMEDFDADMLEDIVAEQNGGTSAYNAAVDAASQIIAGTYEIK